LDKWQPEMKCQIALKMIELVQFIIATVIKCKNALQHRSIRHSKSGIDAMPNCFGDMLRSSRRFGGKSAISIG